MSAHTPPRPGRALTRTERLFVAAYPWAHAAMEGAGFVHGCVVCRGALRAACGRLPCCRLPHRMCGV
jgi:hypothetical protein